MTTQNSRESLSCVLLLRTTAASSTWALAGLVARGAGGSRPALGSHAGAVEHAPQLLHQVVWQAATTAPGDSSLLATARQPLLAAVLASGHRVSLAHMGESNTAPAAQLLQALRATSNGSVHDSKHWLLPASASGAVASVSRPSHAASTAAAAGLHGLLKVAAAEQPTAPDAAVVFGTSTSAGGNQQFGETTHAAAVFAPVLLPASEPASGAQGEPLPPTGAVLITGGLGGLGLLTFGWAQRHKPLAPVVLLGRSGRSTALILALPSVGCVTALHADVATAEEAGAAVAQAAEQHARYTVLHASGMLADALLASQTPSKLRAASAPKVGALQRLSAAAAARPLHQLLAFSSIAGELGTAGQGNYAAANAALDACVAAQRQQGQAGRSVQWGAWAGAGMAAAEPQLLAALLRQGYAAVKPAAGLELLHALLDSSSSSSGTAVLMAAPFDWERFLSSARRNQLPFFAAVRQQAFEPAGTAVHGEPQQAAVAAAQHSVPSKEDLQRQLAELVAEVSGVGPSNEHHPLAEAGLDSIGSVELRNAIVERYGVQAPATVAFDHPSVAALAAWLGGELAGNSSDGSTTASDHAAWPAAPVATLSSPTHAASLTAVASVSCHFPCCAESSDGTGFGAFWLQATTAADVQSVVPLCKWDAGEQWPGGVLVGAAFSSANLQLSTCPSVCPLLVLLLRCTLQP